MQFLFVAEVDNGFQKESSIVVTIDFLKSTTKSDYLKSVTFEMNEALNKAKKEA